MIYVIVHHVDSSVLCHSQELKDLKSDLLALFVIFLIDLGRTYMCRKSVLILVLIIVKTLMGNDLRYRKGIVVYDGYGDLACLDEFLY